MTRLVALVLAFCLAACTGSLRPAANLGATVAVWATSADQTRKLTRLEDLPLGPAQSGGSGAIVIGSAPLGPPIVGFGAAMTDASADLFQTALRPDRRRALFTELFGRQGIGISFVRVPIGASDFSAEHYSLDDMPPGERDPDLRRFSMARPLARQIPALRAARSVNPNLTLMASPWSAPGWMKTTDSLIKGRLRPEAYAAYAHYFVRYLDAMAKAGLPVAYVSMQNEPDFEPADYPGMRVSAAERAAFFAGHLGPALAARRQRTAILDWDHNWDHPEQPLAVLADPGAARYVAGVAWHCYGGSPEVMAQVKAAHPDKDLFFTECSGGQWAPDWAGTLGWMTDNLIIAPARAGGRGSLLWNLALDQNAGPHRGGCGNCRGVVTIDRASGGVTRNVEYYVLGQASKFARPGARLIASEGGPGELSHVAFRNPDGSTALLIHNRAKVALSVQVNSAAGNFAASLPAGEVATFVW